MDLKLTVFYETYLHILLYLPCVRVFAVSLYFGQIP